MMEATSLEGCETRTVESDEFEHYLPISMDVCYEPDLWRDGREWTAGPTIQWVKIGELVMSRADMKAMLGLKAVQELEARLGEMSVEDMSQPADPYDEDPDR